VGAIALAALAGGCSDDSGEQAGESTSTTTRTQAEDGGPTPAKRGPGVAIYFTAGEQFRKVGRVLAPGGSDPAEAVRELVEGPARGDGRVETQIPRDAEVEDVTVTDGGTAVVEVSEAFMNGIPGRAARRDRAEDAELRARVGQLAYTVTQFDNVREARVVAGGEPVEAAADRGDYAKPAEGPSRPERPRGAKSAGTRALQQRLAELRFLPRGAVDGVAGYRTQQAVIAFQSWRGLARDGIVGPATTAALARARPPRPGGRGPSRRIEVYRDRGVALLVKGDRTKRAIHVSTGAPATPTPAGSYSVFRKELRSWSVPFAVWLPYASYFNRGIAFHEYPDVPVYPASHGCVRVPAPEAKAVYRFAEIDTAVIVR
jgi:lipoprotein-anchoring transpeptidase ErfK/SrfK